MCLHVSLLVFMRPFGSLCIFIVPYAYLWIIIGPFVSLCIFLIIVGPFRSLCVLVDFNESLLFIMRSYLSSWVLIGSCPSL